MENKLIFEGAPPFEMPLLQSGVAAAVGDVVILTFYALIPGQGPTPVPILASMAAVPALALAGQLREAGKAALLNVGRSL